MSFIVIRGLINMRLHVHKKDKIPEISRSDMKELMREYIDTHTFVPLEHFACIVKEIEQDIQRDDMEATDKKMREEIHAAL